MKDLTKFNELIKATGIHNRSIATNNLIEKKWNKYLSSDEINQLSRKEIESYLQFLQMQIIHYRSLKNIIDDFFKKGEKYE